MFVFDDKRNFFTGCKRRTVNCSDSGKQLCAVQRSIGAESEANLLRTNGEIQNTELSCAGFIQCNIQQILDCARDFTVSVDKFILNITERVNIGNRRNAFVH